MTTVKQVRTNGVTSNLDTLTLAYDQLGNITSKTGTGIANIGSYQYKTFEAGCANQAGPHAASLVNGKSYCYDLNGSNTEVRKNGSVIRTIVYTGFDLAESIVRDEMTAEGRIQAQVSFKYGTDRAMFKRVDAVVQIAHHRTVCFAVALKMANNLSPPAPLPRQLTMLAMSSLFAKACTNSTKRYIGGYLVITNVGNNAATFDYLLRDSLGSIDTIAATRFRPTIRVASSQPRWG